MSERIAELETKLKDARAGGDEAHSLLASATDLLNSWARESYTTEAKNEDDIKGVIDRLWAYWSAEITRMQEIIDLESRKVGCLNLQLDDKEAELDRMQKALEDAPHDPDCGAVKPRCPDCGGGIDCRCDGYFSGSQVECGPCDCWKSRVLNPQPQTPEPK